MNWRFCMFSALLLVLPSTSLWALEPVDSVARDFKPLAGVVIMATGGEYLIDPDVTKGVREGDLFAVVKPGERIVHPTTGQVLGSLDLVKGYLQVNRVRSGYSYARLLDKGEGIERGDSIQRFEHLDARFWDYAGGGEALYESLRLALPALRWLPYGEAQSGRPASPKADPAGSAALVFVHLQGRLEVRDSQMTLLRSYPLSATTQTLPQPVPAKPAPVVPAPAAPAATTPAGIVIAPAPVAAKSPSEPAAAGIVPLAQGLQEDIWHGPQMLGEPVGMAVMDFDRDGQMETAIAFADRIEIHRLLGRQWQSVARVDLGSRLKALALAAIDLTGDGSPELYLSAADGEQLASVVVEFTGTDFQIVSRNLPWLMRVVDLPGRGPVLLGQELMTGKVAFGEEVFLLQRQGAKLVRGAGAGVPKNTNLYGFLPLPQVDGRTVFARLTADSSLQVVTGEGEVLWRGAERVGGSEGFVERIDPEVVKEQMVKRLYLDAAIKPGRAGEILVPVNEGSTLLGNYRSFDKSYLKALRWDGRALEEQWHTKPQGGYLSDFTLADVDNDGTEELVMTVLFTHAGFVSKARSNLVVYELP
ncbi:MAG: FG-GAP repeat domain-containing protein [Trichloromonadaceae bacterium]